MLMFMLPMTARIYHRVPARKSACWFMIASAMSGLGSAVLRQHARLPRRLSLALALIAFVALALSGEFGAVQGGVLMMLPALLLAVVMFTRPYLGEQAIAHLRGRRAQRKRGLDTPASVIARLRSPARALRGGRLIAVALAGRAPPLALAGCR
jgi:hypothetical protein